jgi:catalase
MANHTPSPPPKAGSFLIIGAVVVVLAGAFAYTAGWFSPTRLTPAKIVDRLAPPGGAALGFRRNHAKGVCFTGEFESNGNGAALSEAQMMRAGAYPVVGRFNLATADPQATDASVPIRGMSLSMTTPSGQTWRSAMIDAPFFPVATPQAFYALLNAAGNKSDPNAMKSFAAAHPEFQVFGAWASKATLSTSFTQDRFNSLNSFIFTNAAGQSHAVRWSFVPASASTDLVPETLDRSKPHPDNFLDADLMRRLQIAPQRWNMVLSVANPGDQTADPSKAWPDDRQQVNAGTLVVHAAEPEANGPCRDINYDPTVLPPGIQVSDDPFPAARSAAYAVSFDRRTAEEKDYPRTASGATTP